MKNEKKAYEAPQVTLHGAVENLTLKGGGGFADMPIGVNDPIGPSNTHSSKI